MVVDAVQVISEHSQSGIFGVSLIAFIGTAIEAVMLQ
jgi:hypothetical protein